MFSGSGKTDQGLSGSDQGDVASGTKQNEFLEGFFLSKCSFFVAQILNHTWIACEVWQGEGVEGRLQSGRGAWGGGERRHLGEVSGNRLERGNIAIY